MPGSNISISLSDKHHEVVGTLKKRLMAKKLPYSQSFAIQIAILAVPPDADLENLAKQNLKTDRRRSGKKQHE
jgi:hypothetical protein